MPYELGLRAWLESTEPYINKKIDPALLTWDEFWKLVNQNDKWHPSSAYNYDLKKFDAPRSEYPELLFRKKIGGVEFEFRRKVEDNYQDDRFAKRTPDGEVLRLNGQVQYFTRDELLSMKDDHYRRYEYSFSVFDGEQQVGVSQDEWGCVLVMVAQEYRGFGLGDMLMKLAWEAEPGKTTGGTTAAGYKVTKRVHTEFVREYLRKGMYSELIKQKSITPERVKAIITSIQGRTQPPMANANLNTNNPKDWLLYGQDGCFILYDRKLKELLIDNYDENMYHWFERFIKGISFAGGGYVATDKFYLHQLGGDTPQIEQFMLQLALSFCAIEGNYPLHIYDQNLSIVDPKTADIQGNLVRLKGKPIDYRGMVMVERQFRKSFDRYDEFHVRLLELAEVKYRS